MSNKSDLKKVPPTKVGTFKTVTDIKEALRFIRNSTCYFYEVPEVTFETEKENQKGHGELLGSIITGLKGDSRYSNHHFFVMNDKDYKLTLKLVHQDILNQAKIKKLGVDKVVMALAFTLYRFKIIGKHSTKILCTSLINYHKKRIEEAFSE